MVDATTDANINSGAFSIQTAASAKRAVVTELPIIDISPFLNDSTVSERRRVAAQLHRACVDIGFFYLTGHGFNNQDFERLQSAGRDFFELPLADKMTIDANLNSAKLGFIRTGGLNPTSNGTNRPDLKERLFLSRELAPGEIYDEKSPAGKSQWPSDKIAKGFEPTVKGYLAKMVDLARALSRVFSLSLELSEDRLERFHDRMACTYAFNYYPRNQAPEDPTWGFTPHTDYGTFTILFQDNSGGLQAQNAAGDWIEVPPIQGTFVVNVGDLFARWTNDRYVSTLHRVINRTNHARLSISFFAIPNPRAEIAVLETCRSASNPAIYEPVIACDYCAELLEQAHRTGRAGASPRTVERMNVRG
jgi:isopenicillin N synthase-like dioxygenase